MNILETVQIFTELAFPVAVSVLLLSVTTRQLDRIRRELLRILLYQGLTMASLNIDIPDQWMRDILTSLDERKKDNG